jgi:hypothetical protein
LTSFVGPHWHKPYFWPINERCTLCLRLLPRPLRINVSECVIRLYFWNLTSFEILFFENMHKIAIKIRFLQSNSWIYKFKAHRNMVRTINSFSILSCWVEFWIFCVELHLFFWTDLISPNRFNYWSPHKKMPKMFTLLCYLMHFNKNIFWNETEN